MIPKANDCVQWNDIVSKLYPLLVFTYIYQSLITAVGYIIEGEKMFDLNGLCTSLNQILSISAPSSFPSPHFQFYFFSSPVHGISYLMGQRLHVGENFPYLVAAVAAVR